MPILRCSTTFAPLPYTSPGYPTNTRHPKLQLPRCYWFRRRQQKPPLLQVLWSSAFLGVAVLPHFGFLSLILVCPSPMQDLGREQEQDWCHCQGLGRMQIGHRRRLRALGLEEKKTARLELDNEADYLRGPTFTKYRQSNANKVSEIVGTFFTAF
ncbi:hypothetical protein F4604DRAFT_1676452 [Suillus subluteus]|nr:hypothetical protein F4604DRAFT_1676452 [Suillus subluteus]